MKRKKEIRHLDFEDRLDIQVHLKNFKSFTAIERELGFDRTTISKEVQRNSITLVPKHYDKYVNTCQLRSSCELKDRCKNGCSKKCISCSDCNNVCPYYILDKSYVCELLHKPPYVCNNCPQRPRCRKIKKIYEAKKAQKLYEENLSTSREGVRLSQEEFSAFDKHITTLISINNQTPFQIVASDNTGLIKYSVSSIYRLTNDGSLSCSRMDFKKAVKYRPRKKNKDKTKDVEEKYAIGRTYNDYLNFIEENPHLMVVQGDTVEGKRKISKSCMMTLLFKEPSLLKIFKLSQKRARDVIKAFDDLEELIGLENFKKYLSIILIDRGAEFKKPTDIEFNRKGQRRCHVFYCDPRASYQKGSLENAHKQIRDVIPKGTDLDLYSQEEYTILMNHINSLPRKLHNGNTAYQEAKHHISRSILNKLNCEEIEPSQVKLNPRLLKKK